jgi:integrase
MSGIGCKPLSDNEISRMTSVLDNFRDRALFVLGLKTGFRISELLSIKVNDCMQYNALKCSITVERRNTKGKHTSRSIPLNEGIQKLLKQYIDTLPSGQVYLFQSQKGNKLSRIQAWRVISGAAEQCRITGKVATHSMRKSFADRVYKLLDKDLIRTQRAMGHKSIQSTVSYLSFNNEDIDNAILKV